MFFDQTKRMALFILIAIFFVFIDRVLKNISLYFLGNYYLVDHIFSFNLQKNYNISFSLPLGGQFLKYLIGIILIVLIFVFLYLYRKRDFFNAGCLAFLILGAASNLYDRFRYGYVIDYFDLKYFTVFNLADVLIVSAVILIMGNLLFNKKDDLINN